MTTFTQMIEGRKFNDKIYGTAKHGFRVYLDGEETFIDGEILKQAQEYVNLEDAKCSARGKISSAKRELKELEPYIARTAERYAKHGREMVLEHLNEAKAKLEELNTLIAECQAIVDARPNYEAVAEEVVEIMEEAEETTPYQELKEEGYINRKFDTVNEVEDFLNGWDFQGFEDYDWHEKDEETEKGERYYEVIIRREDTEDEFTEDRFSIEILAYRYENLWNPDGDYTATLNHAEIEEAIGD